jgi:hypothetical protein
MICLVAASQTRTNRVHIDTLAIKNYLLEETKGKKRKIHQDNDLTVQTIKRGVFVTPGKMIKLATIERQAETHHKFDRMIAYSPEQLQFFIVCLAYLWYWRTYSPS